jgi:hypothetical protein
VNEVFVPGFTLCRLADFDFVGCAAKATFRASWAAVRLMAALPRKRRRHWLIWSDISSSPCQVGNLVTPGYSADRLGEFTSPGAQSHSRNVGEFARQGLLGRASSASRGREGDLSEDSCQLRRQTCCRLEVRHCKAADE